MPTIILLLLLLFLGTVLVLYLTRVTAIRRVRFIEDGRIPAIRSSAFHDLQMLLTNTQLRPGNRIDLLLNGDGTYEPLCADLTSAERVIFLHVFFYKPGQLAEQVAETLIERAQAGVQVFLLFDAFGSHGLAQDYKVRLRAAGVEIALFRPLRFKTLYKVQQRMHVRAVIIDGRIGYTGGFGICDNWLGDGRHPDQWRDTNVRVRGPVVVQLLMAFAANWAEATGDLLLGKSFLHQEPTADEDGVEAGIMYSSPSLGSTNAERFFVLSIIAARERLYITNAYFVPDRNFRRLLMEAAGRGVDVRVLTPGRNTDQPPAWYAARTHYAELIQAGVRIYEYRPTMVHAKTLVADGMWATVGTLNFDNRSMKLNDEVALMMRNERLGQQLQAIFLDDIRYANEVTLAELAGRSWRERLKERASRLVAPLL